MTYWIEAACACNTGKVRGNNEDNFFFDGRILEERNNGLKHPAIMSGKLGHELLFAVFDGMGGENYGETASFAAASRTVEECKRLEKYVIPEKTFLKTLCASLNDAVLKRAEELGTSFMGSTMVSLLFCGNTVYSCNLGDSRAYRLKEKEFIQISKDHLEQQTSHKKAPLTQHLGISEELFIVEPYIAKGEIEDGDQYLLCSDGLSDMLTNIEINAVMKTALTAEDSAQALIDAALQKGGRDNITVIVCRIHGEREINDGC